jgi:hypothetical protein
MLGIKRTNGDNRVREDERGVEESRSRGVEESRRAEEDEDEGEDCGRG